jgi:hypothetical protein
VDQFGKAVIGIILATVAAIIVVKAAESIREAANHVNPPTQVGCPEVGTPST